MWKAGLDEGAERGKVGLNESGTRREHEVAEDGLQGAGHDLVGGTLECHKAHKREQTHDPRRLGENRLKELENDENCVHIHLLR